MIKNRTKFISLALIVIVGFVIYGNSLHNEFIWDDELLILTNEYVKDLDNLPALFTTNIADGSTLDLISSFYRPLQILSYALNYAFWNLDVRAYHLTNITLHVLVAILLYQLAQLMFKNEVSSLIAALLFVSHPIHTEAITYISGRADPLACLFILLTVISYIKYARNQNRISFYFLSIFSYLLALLSKETALIAPLLLLTYDYLYKERKRISFKMHAPYLSLGFIYIVLRKTILNFPSEKRVMEEFAFFQRIPVIFKSLTKHFEKITLPLNLHMEYESILPPITDIQVISGAAIALALILAAIMYRKKERLISFALAWFLLNYLPVSNIYPLNATFAEHWSYIPSLSLFILAGWAAVKICEKGKILRQLGCLILAFLLAGNFYLTAKQNRCWMNPEHFYKRTLEYAPNSYRIHYRLALIYFRKGRIDKAIEKLSQALEINPDYSPAYKNLSLAYIITGDYEKAIDLCERALKIEADPDILHNDLGIAYAAKDQDNKAIIEFEKAISINPDYAEAHSNLGSAYANIGEKRESIVSFKKALEINPDFAVAHNNLARAYYEIKSYDLAIKHCDRAIELGFKVGPEFLELLESFRASSK